MIKIARAAWSFFRKGDIESSILEFQKASNLGNTFAKNNLEFLNKKNFDKNDNKKTIASKPKKLNPPYHLQN